MQTREFQLAVEQRYSQTVVLSQIKRELHQSDELMHAIDRAVVAMEQHLEKAFADQFYPRKNKRLQNLYMQDADLQQIAFAIIKALAPQPYPQLFTAFVGTIDHVIPLDDKKDQLETVSEFIAILAQERLINLTKFNEFSELMIQPNFSLDEKLQNQFWRTQYLPPMFCRPDLLEHNRDCAYLSETLKNQSVVLRAPVQDIEICLDVLNTLNQIPLAINEYVLTHIADVPPSDLNVFDLKMWRIKESHTYEICADLINAGNHFYLTWQPDKRGRMYSQGHEVQLQGNPYRKGLIEFAQRKLVTGFES